MDQYRIPRSGSSPLTPFPSLPIFVCLLPWKYPLPAYNGRKSRAALLRQQRDLVDLTRHPQPPWQLHNELLDSFVMGDTAGAGIAGVPLRRLQVRPYAARRPGTPRKPPARKRWPGHALAPACNPSSISRCTVRICFPCTSVIGYGVRPIRIVPPAHAGLPSTARFPPAPVRWHQYARAR